MILKVAHEDYAAGGGMSILIEKTAPGKSWWSVDFV